LLVADAYDQLLRVSLLPYVTVSLISGIGASSRAQAVLIGTRVGTVVLTKWPRRSCSSERAATAATLVRGSRRAPLGEAIGSW
jgi:hypothetical protein